MIPYDIDPSLHTGAPPPESLGDGFSPRPSNDGAQAPVQQPVLPPEEALAEKSDF